ncbi:alpha/beta fold hydrolase [Uniformispora flossi]|uniref:alpha/beta fold hydrolase n=1 Tax=Uniformispora flossi TaxID=3390723 RepID=UPI003C2B6578
MLSNHGSGRPRPPGAFVRVDGTVLHVVQDGAGPTVLVTSGLACAWFDWDTTVPLVAPHGRVVRFDRPGLGLSAPDPRPPTLYGEAERLRAVAEAVGAPGPYVIVAHSYAGFHAEAFARLHPEHTAGVVLVDASAEPRARTRPAPAARLALAHAIGGTFRRTGLSRPVGPALRRLAVRGFSRRGRDAGDPEWTRRSYASGRFLTAAFTENTTYLDQAAELLRLRDRTAFPDVPLRVLAAAGGREPDAVKARWLDRQRALAAMAPRGRCDIVEDAAHLLMIDRPDAVAAAVRDVLAEA